MDEQDYSNDFSNTRFRFVKNDRNYDRSQKNYIRALQDENSKV